MEWTRIKIMIYTFFLCTKKNVYTFFLQQSYSLVHAKWMKKTVQLQWIHKQDRNNVIPHTEHCHLSVPDSIVNQTFVVISLLAIVITVLQLLSLCRNHRYFFRFNLKCRIISMLNFHWMFEVCCILSFWQWVFSFNRTWF